MRGDRPSLTNGERLTKTFTPHARGSTLLCLLRTLRRIVYPACAGIDPFLSLFFTLSLFLPRMRGDRPHHRQRIHALTKFTPHARGSTLSVLSSRSTSDVYPACAGIDPTYSDGHQEYPGLPRMRGDRPVIDCIVPEYPMFTPHARGSTSFRFFPSLFFLVYPACAGIDLLY